MGSLGSSADKAPYPAGTGRVESYREGREALDQVRTPLLFDTRDPHQRFYIAALDGTGNSASDDDPADWTSVARIARDVRERHQSGDTRIAGGYVEGTFTQNGTLRKPLKLADGLLGVTFKDRVEDSYYQLCLQAKKWLEEDPNAQIRVASLGFSRGAEEVAALQHMIEERGIRDPEGVQFTRDGEGLITSIEYANRPPLVAPGKILQAGLLADPVATGVKDEVRTHGPSVLSLVQIDAADERRDQFAATDHIPLGFSEDKRNLHIVVGGVHGSVGNAYRENGLGSLSEDLQRTFLNRLSDKPFLPDVQAPKDPAMYVVHRSETHLRGAYTTRQFDRNGFRTHLEDLSPERGIQRKPPISEELESQIERRTFDGPGRSSRPSPSPTHQQHPKSPTDLLLDQAFAAYMGNDGRRFSDVMREYGLTPAGQQWEQQQGEHVRAMREQDALRGATPQPDVQEHTAPRAPAMRM